MGEPKEPGKLYSFAEGAQRRLEKEAKIAKEKKKLEKAEVERTLQLLLDAEIKRTEEVSVIRRELREYNEEDEKRILDKIMELRQIQDWIVTAKDLLAGMPVDPKRLAAFVQLEIK